MDAEFLADAFAAYARLREQCPVHRAVAPDGAPVWLVTRYAEVRAGLTDPRLSLDRENSRTGYRGFSLPAALDANLLNMDPPEHARLRRILTQAFTASRATPSRSRVQAIADELLDALPAHGSTDLLDSFAAPLPITVICELLGVPERDRADFRDWSDAMLAPDPEKPDLARDAVLSLHQFLIGLLADKRAAPADDLLSALVTAGDEHDRLSEEELTSAAFLVLFAGYENTVSLIGNGVAALLSRPAALAKLRAEPESLPSAVHELLRFEPPPQLAIRRFALWDLEIGGHTIPAGDTVLLSLASANRDTAEFAEPDTLRLDRADNRHLGFGHGPHFCIGASLAQLEVEIGIGTLLRRLPDLALAVPSAELEWRPSFRNRGLRRLPVTF
ncbi:MAG: cytochrome P450 [Pseudonocardiaceae bacterium]|nr:cytochrome P450 [Pseudonocardiaceae bacterium]